MPKKWKLKRDALKRDAQNKPNPTPLPDEKVPINQPRPSGNVAGFAPPVTKEPVGVMTTENSGLVPKG